MSHIDTPWTRLASRTARGVLSRKGATYDDLAQALENIGVQETSKAIELKIQRGGFKCSFFLQLLYALGADLPTELQSIVDSREDWNDACRQAAQMIAGSSLSAEKLAKRLEQCGVQLKPTQIESQMNSGVFTFVFLLQLSYLSPKLGLERFVDASDLEKAAKETAATAT